MKKILFLAAGLMIAGSSFAAPCDKHKDKAACAKTSKENCKEKACCKKGASTSTASTTTTATPAATTGSTTSSAKTTKTATAKK